MISAPTSPQSHDQGEPLYNLWRTRTDNWNRLRDIARRLHRGVESQEEGERLDEACRLALEALEPLEPFFAFPGWRAFERISAYYQQKNWALLSRQTIRLNRLLTTGSFRRLDLQELKIQGYSDLLDLDEFTDDVYRKIGEETAPLLRHAHRGRPRAGAAAGAADAAARAIASPMTNSSTRRSWRAASRKR